MREALWSLLVFGAVVGAAAAGSAVALDPPPTPVPAPAARGAACDAQAIVADPDPKGLNVRAAPKGKVVGRLPKDTEVSLVECRAGWVRIDRAWNAEHEDREDWPLGWVHPSMLTTSLKTPEEYGPDTRPRLLTAPREDAEGEVIPLDPVPTVSLVGCEGRFIRVKLTWKALPKKTGWLDASAHCPSTVTTCP